MEQKEQGRYMGIDYGAQRVGVALSDEAGIFAFPHSILQNDGTLLDAVREILDTEHVATVVVGKSQTYGGEDNPIMTRAREFAKTLEQIGDVTVVFEDETLTSQQARRAFERQEKTRKPDKKENVDASAAALILQAYLDKRPTSA